MRGNEVVLFFILFVVCYCNHLQKVQVYGGITSYAYYFVDLLIGSPNPQIQSVIIDTGSPTLAIPCQETCNINQTETSQCGVGHFDNLFSINSSQTAQWLPCNENCVCENNRCKYELQYGEGSSIYGYWVSDYVSFASHKMSNHPVYATFGCHTKVTDLFLSQKANGIMGLAFSFSRDYISVVDSFFQDTTNGINRDVFAVCLAYEGGEITFGGWDSYFAPLEGDFVTEHLTRIRNNMNNINNFILPNILINPKFNMFTPIKWTQLIDPYMYVVVLTGIQVEDKVVPIAKETEGLVALVDSGATRSSFPTEVVNILNVILERGCSQLPGGCSGSRYETASKRVCFKLPRGRTDIEDYFDPLIIQVQGGELWEWPATSYLFPTLSETNWCLGVRERNDMTTLGASFFTNALIVFDRERQQIGYKPYVPCPSYSVEDRSEYHKKLKHGLTSDGRNINDLDSNRFRGDIHSNTENISALSLGQKGYGKGHYFENKIVKQSEYDNNDPDDDLPPEVFGFNFKNARDRLFDHINKKKQIIRDKLNLSKRKKGF